MAASFQLSTSPTLGSLQPSLTLGITAKFKAMRKEGVDVVGLCAGEPDFDTPEYIKQAAIEALHAGQTKYTPAVGTPELRAAIAAKLSRQNGVACEAANVIVAPGAKYSVFTSIVCLCGAGDEVLLPVPFWLSYEQMVQAAGATAVRVPTTAENNYCVTRAALEQQVTERTKLLVLNTPSNPTGAVYPRAVLEDIAALAVERGFMVLADEIYEKLVYDEGFEHISIAALNDEIAGQTITVNGFSKAYSMTGWRLGYLAAPTWLTQKIAAMQSHSTSNPTSFAQAGALAAIQGSDEAVATMRNAFRERRDRIYELLSAIPGVSVIHPRGAFYIFADISGTGLDSMTFADRLLDEKHVAVIPGLPFGADECVRLSYATDMATIEKGCARFAEFCAELV